MILDYNYKRIFEAWKPNKKGYPYASLDPIYVEITLYKQHVCDAVNARYETSFVPAEMSKIDVNKAEEIWKFLSNKDNHLAGHWGDNWHELSKEYWSKHRRTDD